MVGVLFDPAVIHLERVVGACLKIKSQLWRGWRGLPSAFERRFGELAGCMFFNDVLFGRFH